MEYNDEQKADIQKQIDAAVKTAVENATKGTLTQEQFNQALSKRIGEMKEKHEADLKEKEEIAKMSATEKQKHDMEKLQKSLEEKDGIIKRNEHSAGIAKLMAEKKISGDFTDVFIGISDLTKAGEVMDKFNATLKTKVDAGVDEKILPHVPKQPGNQPPKDAFEEGFDSGSPK